MNGPEVQRLLAAIEQELRATLPVVNLDRQDRIEHLLKRIRETIEELEP